MLCLHVTSIKIAFCYALVVLFLPHQCFYAGDRSDGMHTPHFYGGDRSDGIDVERPRKDVL